MILENILVELNNHLPLDYIIMIEGSYGTLKKIELIIVADDYDADSIQVLEGLEAVKKRPGMYLGDPHDGSALHHCIWEVVDNSVDEHLAGHTDSIDITLHQGGSLSVRITEEESLLASMRNMGYRFRGNNDQVTCGREV